MSAPANFITDEPAPLFTPFEWVSTADQMGPYDMLSDVRDLAAGTSLVLAMIERSQLSTDAGGAPLLDAGSISRLTRMSIAAMNCIEGRIDEHFDWMNNRGAAQRKASEGFQ